MVEISYESNYQMELIAAERPLPPPPHTHMVLRETASTDEWNITSQLNNT